ncbi:MAG: LysR family transcriptional regulator [Marinoscillum sp.]
MELKHFRLIKTIADEGNIANSSERLCLTPSALSHQLRTLEESLGLKIFTRNRKEWVLTAEGTELYHLATNVLNSVDEKLQQLKSLTSNTGGKIQVSTECYSFYLLFPFFLQKMSALYPQIEIQLNFDATHKPISKLLSYDVDIAITTEKPAIESLTSIEIIRDELFVLMHKQNELQSKKYIEASDFTNLHLIIHSYPMETVYVYQNYLKPNDVLPKKISAIPLTEVTLEMVNANLGITCIPKWMLKSFNHQQDLVFKPIGRNGLKRSLYLVIRNEDRNKIHYEDFVNNFEETLQSEWTKYSVENTEFELIYNQ